jgi:hypothetical protein
VSGKTGRGEGNIEEKKQSRKTQKKKIKKKGNSAIRSAI